MGIKTKSVDKLVDAAKIFVFDTSIKEIAARNIVNIRLKELDAKYKTLTSERSKKLIEGAKKTIVDKFKEQYKTDFYQSDFPVALKSLQEQAKKNMVYSPNFLIYASPRAKSDRSFGLQYRTPPTPRSDLKHIKRPKKLITFERPIEAERQKQPIEQPIEAPVNASAPPLDINSVPRQSTKNKGLRLAARNRLFLNKYGDDLLKGIKWGAGLGVAGGGIDGIWRLAANTYREMLDVEPIEQNVVNTPVKSNNTNQQRIPSNNQSDSTQSSTQNTSQTNTSNASQANTTPAQNNTSNASQTNTSTQKNTSRTTQANTSNRNTQTTSNKQTRNKSRNTSNNKSNTTSRKKLISKAQVKKAFADEFKKAYQNATIDVDNASTRDYYSETLAMKSQLDKQRKDEVAKLQQQVQSLQNQLNQLTNPIY